MVGKKVGALAFLEDDGIRYLDYRLKADLNRDYPGWQLPSQTWMVPNVFEMKGGRDKKGQLAEEQIFNLLHDFGNNCKEPMFVVHSYKFREKIENWQNLKFDEKKYVIGEHDFVLIHRNHGVIFLQVKSSTKCKSFGEANSQLEKDKKSIKYFAQENLKGELQKKMNKELHGEQHAYVVMPELERGNSPHGSNGIFKEDCESVGAFSMWWKHNILPRTHPDQEVYDCLVMRFVGLVHGTPYPLSSSIERSNKVLVWKTAEQLKVLLGSPEEAWITGPAGSGKTWILIEKVKELGASQRKEMILVVCFNKPLSKMLKQQFKDFSCVVKVIRFQQLLKIITGKRFHSELEREENVNLAVRILEGKTPEYDHIFVDECQDLIGDQWPVIFQKLWKGNDDDSGTTEVTGYKYKWFFYDTNQYVGWSGERFEKHQKALKDSFKLGYVLRNTGNIFEQSKKYLRPSCYCLKEITLGHNELGLNIKWQESLPPGGYQGGAQSVAECIADLRKKKVLEADICVLVQSVGARNLLSTQLKKLHVDNHNAEEQFEENKNVVVVESIRRFKGLESKVVILCNPEFTNKNNKHIKELLYTAISRCSCYLVIITSWEGLRSLQSVDGVGMEYVDDDEEDNDDDEEGDDDDFDVEMDGEDDYDDDDKDSDGSTLEMEREDSFRDEGCDSSLKVL